MASRLLSRSKTLARSLLFRPSVFDPMAAASSHFLRPIHSPSVAGNLPPPSDPRSATYGHVHSPAVASILSSQMEPSKKVRVIESEGAVGCGGRLKEMEVTCFSPLEAAATKGRSSSVLQAESLKLNRTEQSINITYALIPPLLLVAKTPLTTSLLIFAVYWQIYGFFKEIFLDYVHQEVTRKWVLVYFKVLLLILAKDTIVNFGLF